jgi:hypothetical protein
VDALLKQTPVQREPMMDDGIWFVRRAYNTEAYQGYQYFIANRSEKPVSKWITLGSSARSVVLLDPRFDNRSGLAAVHQISDGKFGYGKTQVYLQLLPGESRILRTSEMRPFEGPAWPNTEPYQALAQAADPKMIPLGPAQTVTGTWDVKFVEGGPALPTAFTTTTLASWTTRDDAEAKRFAGTALYTITIDAPSEKADDWLLDLGRVGDAAHVKVNGKDAGGAWCAPWQIPVGKFLLPGKNVIEVEVTNLGLNRVRDLDIRQVNWKYFYDANVNGKTGGGKFDASRLPLRASGLLGPVLLQPVKNIVPTQ